MNGDESLNDASAALQALEEFVVNNDALLALEERIGRFNIFDALRVERVEIRHSNFLAWLLDPAESHGQGSLFLKAILMDLLSQTPPSMRPLSPVELDGAELRGVEIRREWRRIDLLIICREPAFVIAVENKVDSGEHSDQLERYRSVIDEMYTGTPSQFVFLTVDGDAPSDHSWVPYTYGDIHRVLSRCLRTNASSIGDDVMLFLGHYLRLIGSRFMENSKIDELCRKICKNHRQALDLIWEYQSRSRHSYLLDIRSRLEQPDSPWKILLQRKSFLTITSQAWTDFLPPIGNYKDRHPSHWLVFTFNAYPGECWLSVYVGPMDDDELRFAIVDRLTREGNEFGFKLHPKTRRGFEKNTLPEWVTVSSHKVFSWGENEEPDIDILLRKSEKILESLLDRTADLPTVIQKTVGADV